MTFQKQMRETGLESNIFSTSNVKATDNRDSHDGDMRWWKGPHTKLLILKQNNKKQTNKPPKPQTKKKKPNKQNQTPRRMPLLLHTNVHIQGLGAGRSETCIMSLTPPL